MKFLFVCLALALAVSSVAAQREGPTFINFVASGDPHFITFDGVLHDFQGTGSWVIARGPAFEVQCEFFYCNQANKAVTCIKGCIIALFNEQAGKAGADTVYVKWSTIPGAVGRIQILDTNKVATTDVAPSAFPKTGVSVVSGTYNVNYAGSQVRITPAIAGSAFPSVSYGMYYLALSLPSFWTTRVNGLAGYFDGSASNEFVGSDGVNYLNGTLGSPITVKGQRYNNKFTNAWGATWAVAVGGPNEPLAVGHHERVMVNGVMTNKFVEYSFTTQAVPSDATQDELNKLTFTDVNLVGDAEAACRNSFPGQDANFQNCLYDRAVVQDTTVAASISAAAAELNTISPSAPSSSSGNDNTKIGLGVGLGIGLVALAAIVVAIVLYTRLNRVKREHSKALILLQEKNGGAPSSSDDIRLTENI